MAAALSSANFISLPGWHSTWTSNQPMNYVQFQGFRLQKRWGFAATSRKKIAAASDGEGASENGPVVGKKKKKKKEEEEESKATAKRVRPRTRKKKPVADDVDNNAPEEPISEDTVPSVEPVSNEAGKKVKKTRRKAEVEEEKSVKKDEVANALEFDGSDWDEEEASFLSNEEDSGDEDLDFLDKNEGEDISDTYGWPPLVCCFGALQHAFVPSGRRANRLLKYEIHDRMRDAYWEPDRFVRAPGGCAGGVAVSLASLGGKVAFMGKLGDDEFGQTMLYYMNVMKVQTRSVIMDGKKTTAVSQMRFAKRGRFRMICTRSSAEDSLTKSEINVDLLKEAKMFYFNTHPLLDRSMRSSTLYAMKITKKLGGVIFYDVNLPLPLWQSHEETKEFIREAWNSANVIEVTKQELEFLCGIEPTEEFDTRDNDDSKFVHYKKEVVDPLWHENLQVLFVTNGTSKIHFYTKEHNGSVLGTEDPPLTPFTSDMSASGDGIVAGLIRMLSVQPDLLTDAGYLRRSIKYAIDCGVIDQWLPARTRGFPVLEGMDEVEPDASGIQSIREQEQRTVLSPSQ